ncbi:hypothetical protein EDD29_7637 [Actinocorallia herbida]|uniref:Uncharacterized protein n=1 Tax=Actinocorallia herbida TaxID=58109 RepID=A0A3N1D8Q2_9ACTN|nr:hypothetical protein [Actinocorallia herbida]ROO89927.1 hypothetical protein EDD29_7637 [Actinocorallia herbida]
MSATERTRWAERRTNPVSRAIGLITWLVVAVLVIGMLLVWADANQANDLVNFILNLGEWLAEPFDDVFTPSGHDAALYQNWTLAAVVYWAVGSLLAYLTRR